jgi:raffinose/stachyose/melibiose transport system permease protein
MRRLSKKWQIIVMLAPALLLYGGYLIYPVFYAVYYSFTNYIGVGTATFAGASNYTGLIHDTYFWSSLKNTGIILGIAVVALIPLAFFAAVLLGGRIRGSSTMRAVVFAPAIIAPILVGLIWVFILDPSIGLINAVLAALGIPARPEWIGGTELSPLSFGIVFTWEQVGFIATIFYAGIKVLPSEVLEAAELDRASKWQQLWYVTIPMMRSTFNICTVIVVTGVFKIFELVYVLTGGGPIHDSDVLASYMYFTTFTDLRYGYGMAVAVVILILGIGTTVGYLMFSRRRATR